MDGDGGAVMGHVCDICLGINPESCPGNWDAGVVLTVCPECGGSGETYWDDWNGERVSEEEWLRLPEDRRGTDVCEECGGSGEVEVESE